MVHICIPLRACVKPWHNYKHGPSKASAPCHGFASKSGEQIGSSGSGAFLRKELSSTCSTGTLAASDLQRCINAELGGWLMWAAAHALGAANTMHNRPYTLRTRHPVYEISSLGKVVPNQVMVCLTPPCTTRGSSQMGSACWGRKSAWPSTRLTPWACGSDYSARWGQARWVQGGGAPNGRAALFCHNSNTPPRPPSKTHTCALAARAWTRVLQQRGRTRRSMYTSPKRCV